MLKRTGLLVKWIFVLLSTKDLRVAYDKGSSCSLRQKIFVLLSTMDSCAFKGVGEFHEFWKNDQIWRRTLFSHSIWHSIRQFFWFQESGRTGQPNPTSRLPIHLPGMVLSKNFVMNLLNKKFQWHWNSLNNQQFCFESSLDDLEVLDSMMNLNSIHSRMNSFQKQALFYKRQIWTQFLKN